MQEQDSSSLDEITPFILQMKSHNQENGSSSLSLWDLRISFYFTCSVGMLLSSALLMWEFLMYTWEATSDSLQYITSHPLCIKTDEFKNTWNFISLYLFSFQIVDVKILKKKDNGLEVSILEDEDNVVAWIPMLHLSDFVATSKLLWHCLQEGDVLPRVMYLSDKGEHIVSFATSTRQTKCGEGGVSQHSRESATNIRIL